MKRKYSEIEEIENVINKIKDGTIVYITDCDNEEMMFVCQREGHSFSLYSKDYGHYSPTADTLEELQAGIQSDWLDDLICDIEIFDSEDMDS